MWLALRTSSTKLIRDLGIENARKRGEQRTTRQARLSTQLSTKSSPLVILESHPGISPLTYLTDSPLEVLISECKKE